MTVNEQIQLDVLDATYDGNVLEMTLAPEDMSEAFSMALFNNDWDKEAKKFVDNPETTERFNETIKTYFGFDELGQDEIDQLIGRTLNVFKNGTNVTLWEVQTLLKPTEDMLDQTFFAEIVDCKDYDASRRLVVELYEEEETDEGTKKGQKLEGRYFINFAFGTWIASKKVMLPNKADKKTKQGQFKEKLLVDWDNWEELKGTVVKVEAKSNPSFSENARWLELKPRKAPKK